MSRRDHLSITVKRAVLPDCIFRRSRGTFVLAGMIAAFATLGEASAQSLNEALSSAYLANPELLAQRAALEATNELLPQAIAGWRPTLTIDTETSVSQVDNGLNDGSRNTNGVALTLSQNLYQGGETTAAIGRAEWLVRAERARLGIVEQDVLVDTVSAYVGLFTSRAILRLSKQNEARLKQQLTAVKDRFSVGDVTRTDIAQAEARLAGAVADRIEAAGDIRAAEATFKSVIGLEPDALTEPEPLSSLPDNEADAQALAEAANPSLVLAEANLAASQDDVRIAKASLLPSLDLEGVLSHTDEPSLAIDRQDTASVSLRLRVPLYQGGGAYASVRQNKRIANQRRSDLDTVRRAAREGVTIAWQTLMTARSTIASIEQQVRAAAIALEGTQREAEAGLRSVLDVLDQESDLFQAELDLVSAKGDEIVASYQLQAAIGQLNATELSLDVDAYDPGAHFGRTRNRWFGLDD